MQIKIFDGAIQIDGKEMIPKSSFKAWVDDKNNFNIVSLIVHTQLIEPTLFSSIEIDGVNYPNLEDFNEKIGQSFFKSAAGGGGITYKGTVNDYAELSTISNPHPNDAYYNLDDGLLYVFNGISFPADGDGINYQGPQGISPNIGVNGNWWIGGIDTGTLANGESPQLRMLGAKMQWKLPSQGTWTDLYDFTGLLWQKGTESARLGIVSPAVGTLFFQTDKAIGLYEYKGGAWHFNGERLIKTVTASTYTLTSEDRGYSVHFTNAAGCTVTVPSAVFAQGVVCLMKQKGGLLNFVAGSGMTLNTAGYQIPTTIGVNSIVYVEFDSTSVGDLRGDLQLS